MISFDDNTYFPPKNLADLGVVSYLIGFDSTNNSYFKLVSTQINYSSITPANYTAVDNKLNSHLTGIDTKLGTLQSSIDNQGEHYDSGWINFPEYSNANTFEFGFVPYSNNSNTSLQYRVINHEVKLRGKLIIPLAATNGGSPITNLASYKATETTFVGTASSDWSIDSTGGYDNGHKLFSNSILNTANDYLTPDREVFLGTVRCKREMNLLDDVGGQTEKLTTVYAKVDLYMTASGKLLFRTGPSDIVSTDPIAVSQFDGMSILQKDSPIITSPFPMFGDAASFGAYFSNANGSISASYTYPITFKGYVSELGGFTLDLDNLSFTINKATTLSNIKSDVSYLQSQL